MTTLIAPILALTIADVVASNDSLGSYRLIERIGAGGMGEVWKAEDTRLARVVAVKILPGAVAGDSEAVARMRREARMAAQLNHPNIATIHSFEEIGDRLFIVMEYVDGEPLTALIGRGSIAEAELCRIGRGIAEALAEAHAKGVIHRDIKPDNVMVAGHRVKVLDFGIAKQIDLKAGSNDLTAPLLTQQGMIIGTVHYMSPEQALGKTLDARTDLFSLGVVLYQAASGRLPFAGETVTDTITRIVRDDPPRVGNASPRMAAIINRCLRKNREERYGTAAELAAALDAQMARAATAPMTDSRAAATPTLLTGSKLQTVTQTKPPRWTWVAFVAVFSAVATALVVTSRQDKPPAMAPPLATATAAAPTATLTVTTSDPKPTATMAAAPTISEPPVSSPAPSSRPVRKLTGEDTVAPPAVAPPMKSPDELFAAGVTAMTQRRPVEARVAFASALRREPSHLKSQLGLAILDGNRQRAAAIAQELREQRVVDPDLERLRRLMVENRERQGGPPRQGQGRRPRRP